MSSSHPVMRSPFFHDGAQETPPQTAPRSMEDIDLPPQASQRLALLREKNQRNELTSLEQRELQDYLDALGMIELIKANTRASCD